MNNIELDIKILKKVLNSKLFLGKYPIINSVSVGRYGNSIDIVSPELLAILKLDLGRTKDINDGFALLMSGNVDRDIYISYAKKLKNTLNDYESIIGYCDLIL